MPELPEVETTLRGIEPFLIGQTLESTVIRNGALRWPVSEQVYTLANQPIDTALRRGKYIIVQFSSGALLIHLGMSGNLRLVEKNTLPQKHDHVDLILHSGKIIRLNDPRRFGCVLWSSNWRQHPLISTLGLEPLADEFNGRYLYLRARTRKIAIKQLIMDGRVLVGVGNIYANEALFLSGIDPRRSANRISLTRMEHLALTLKQVLTSAIEQGGTTLKDFVGSDGKPGYFKQQLNVYGRAGEPCVKCDNTLQEIKQNNRATVYCSQCQA